MTAATQFPKEVSMRIGPIFVLIMLLAGVMPASAQDGNVATIEAVDNDAARVDQAFESQDAKTIKALTTSSHIAVTHYYDKPESIPEQIASLPDLKYHQTNLTEPMVTLLAPDVAMRTLTAKFDGTFRGKSLTARVFITSILVKRDGKWLERFYQVTALGS
jgi:hypothetical protein